MEKIDTSFFARERAAELSVVGTSVQRADARGHVTGRTQFYEDVTFPNTLHLKMVRSSRHWPPNTKATKRPRRGRRLSRNHSRSPKRSSAGNRFVAGASRLRAPCRWASRSRSS